MKLLFDFFPILLFFIGYKLWGIYTATAIAMGASLAQVLYHRIRHQRYENMHLFNLGIIFVLGGATLFFHNDVFIKWKPTGIYWLTALVFMLSPLVTKKPLIQKMMENNISLPEAIWYRLNYAWVIFFVCMGCVNLYVAYHFSTDTWVNFKLFGCASIILVFVFLQAMYLTRHALEDEPSNDISTRETKPLRETE